MSDEEPTRTELTQRGRLVERARASRRRFRRGSVIWSAAYHVSLFGAAALSAAAALVLKIPAVAKEDEAAILAAAAALLTTLNALGNFQTKWKADRNAFYSLDELLIDAESSEEVSNSSLGKRLSGVIRDHRRSWSADGQDPRQAPTSEP